MQLIRKTILAAAIVLLPLAAAAELIPGENNKGKWGYYDQNGTIVVKAQYDMAMPFNGQYAKVRKGDKWGLIDQSGQEVIKPQCEELTDFFNGMALVKRNGKYGYMRDDLSCLIPCEFTSLGTFNADGLAWVCKGNKYGIYRIDGSVFIEPNFASLGVFVPWEQSYNADSYKDKSFVYKTHKEFGGSHRLLGMQIISFEMLSEIPANPIGFYCSKQPDGYYNGVYTKDGQPLILPGKYYTAFFPTDGFSLVRTKNADNSNFINISTGEKLFKKDVADAWAFYDGVAMAQVKEGKGYKWYFLDKQGNAVTGVGYDEIFPRKNGVYVTMSNEKYGMCDARGKEIIPACFNYISSTVGNLWAASRDGSVYGYLNNKGEFQIAPTYQYTACFKKPNAAFVKQNGKFGVIDEEGSIVVPIEWDDAYEVEHENPEFVWVGRKTGSETRYLQFNVKTQSLQTANSYLGAWNFGHHFDDVAIVNNGENKFGCIDRDGNVIIPLGLENTATVIQAYQELNSRSNKTWRAFDTHRYQLRQATSSATYPLTEVIKNEMWEY